MNLTNAKNYNEVAASIGAAADAGQPLSPVETRDAPWCLWETTPALARDRHALTSILQAVIRSEKARPFRALAGSYATSFRDDLPGLDEVVPALTYLADKWHEDERSKPWTELHERFGFFDPAVGPRRLAQAVIEQDRAVVEIFRERQIGAIGENGNYARAVTAALLRELATSVEADHLARLAKVQRFALDGRKPLFEEQLPDVAEALLRPLVGRSVGEATQDTFLQVVLDLLGDPRLQPFRWSQTEAALRVLVTDWLSRQSLRQFLDIVATVAPPQMFRARRRFWEAVYQHCRRDGRPVGTWVALGPHGAQIARSKLGKGANFAKLIQEEKYVEPGHAVLLFEVGDTIIADWSHNGKCHVWSNKSGGGAPDMYRPSYGSNQVQAYSGRGNNETASTLSWAHQGDWQDKIAGRLKSAAGLRVLRSEYMEGS